jgi:hypothetical protein
LRHCPRCQSEFAAERVECSDCGGPLADGPSPRFEPRSVEPDDVPPAAGAPDGGVACPSALPPFGRRHCPSCTAEFETDRITCADCGTALVPGPSPSFEPAADDAPLELDDFVALVALRNGEAADALGDVLADAGIATVVTGSAGIRMHAPGHAPMGPLSTGTVDLGVFPEDIERASEMLGGWAGKDAIVDDDEPPETTPARAPAPPHAAPQSTSPIGIVLLVAAVAAMVAAAWMLSKAR